MVRPTVFATAPAGLVGTAAVGGVPGSVVLAWVGTYYAAVLAVSFWPGGRQAKGELQSRSRTEEWK